MPFTPSHAILALPFGRSRTLADAGIPAAVAVGAMAPDLPLFVRGTPIQYAWTHSFPWIAVTASVAFALLLVWRCLLRPAVRELSPPWLAARLPLAWDATASVSARETVSPSGWRDRPARRLFPVVLAAALLFGVATHIAWDLFTHGGRLGIPLLQASWGPLPGFRWLQHGSSVVGLIVLAAWAIVRLRRADRAASVRRLLPARIRVAWWMSLPLALLVAWTVGAVTRGPFTAEFTPQHLAYLVLPPACAIWGALTIALCIAIQVMRRR